MQLVTMLALVVTFPILCLGFLLWMAWMEDSLPEAVRRAERRPDPPPILAVPVTALVADPAPTQVAEVAEVAATDSTPVVAEPAQGAPVVTVHVPAQRGETILGAEPHGEAEPAVAPGLA